MSELRRRQLLALVRIELGRTLLAGRAFPLYAMALFPVAIAVLFNIVVAVTRTTPPTVPEMAGLFAAVYQLMLRSVVYFGCVWIFMNLFRGEIIDRSLHYYFLAPIRRDLLAAGKYVTGWLATTIVLATSTVATYGLMLLPGGGSEATEYLLGGPGAAHALTYAATTALACLGYGAVFLLIGLFFRSPVIPAVLIFLWEGINFMLPASLKKISVVFYLNSLAPVRTSEGPFALLAAPVPAWLALAGLLLFTALMLVIAGWRIRRMEISYATD
jgi:ABC-type transport system involved in multi-copper enzyme maturation permease subunit